MAGFLNTAVNHQYRPHKLSLDRNRFVPETIKGLQDKGHKTEFVDGIARVYGIKRIIETGVLEGSFDSRGEGSAAGY